MQKHREVTKDHKKATKGHKCHHGITGISTKYLLENAEVTKNKNDQSNPKKGGQTRKPPMPLAAGFRGQILKFTVRSNHVQSQNHLQKEWSTKCTNPCYMTHRVLKARMNCVNQNPGSKSNLQAKHRSLPMPMAAPHSLRVQNNPDPNKLHNASKSCSKQNTSTKIMLSRYLTIRR